MIEIQKEEWKTLLEVRTLIGQLEDILNDKVITSNKVISFSMKHAALITRIQRVAKLHNKWTRSLRR